MHQAQVGRGMTTASLSTRAVHKHNRTPSPHTNTRNTPLWMTSITASHKARQVSGSRGCAQSENAVHSRGSATGRNFAWCGRVGGGMDNRVRQVVGGQVFPLWPSCARTRHVATRRTHKTVVTACLPVCPIVASDFMQPQIIYFHIIRGVCLP